MFKSIESRCVIAAAIALLPTTALAHPGFGPATGLTHGFLHPLTGIDHILAMVAVGILAANLGGRALWAVPLTFLAVMAVGGAFGMAGVHVPFVEAMIALSVVVLGLAVAIPRRCPAVAACLMAGVFAFFHGHAHGTEMAATMSAVRFGLGFIIGTALLHAVGIGLGLGVARLGPARARQVSMAAGLVIATIGVGLSVALV
jgi:urease accessory protein